MSTAITPSPKAPPVWPRAAQIASALVVLTVLGALGCHLWSMQRRAAEPTTLQPGPLAFRVDLNRADRAQLLQLPGVGETLVQRIEDYRTSHYGFRSVDELANITGIGPLTVERLRYLVYVEEIEGEEDAAPIVRSKQRISRKESSSAKATISKKAASLKAPIDVNRASADELQRLPGVGPRMAERIIAKRTKTPFQSVDDLRHVSGIGPITLEKLRPYVTVGEALTRKE